MRGDRQFPLAQFMRVRDRHPILSISTSKGRWGVSGERCYFDICETLTEEALEIYVRFLLEIQRTEVEYNDPEHDYTFLSLVVLTSHLTDTAIIKKIKRFRSEKTYSAHEKQFGWSSCRLCVIDLANDKQYLNAMAGPLRTRLFSKSL